MKIEAESQIFRCMASVPPNKKRLVFIWHNYIARYDAQMSIDLKHYKKLLDAKKIELLQQVEAGKESAKPVELDQTSVGRLSRIDAIQLQSMALAEEDRRKNELARIEAAYGRIETKDYGYCVSCEEEIAPKRLEFDPAVASCISCASGKA